MLLRTIKLLFWQINPMHGNLTFVHLILCVEITFPSSSWNLPLQRISPCCIYILYNRVSIWFFLDDDSRINRNLKILETPTTDSLFVRLLFFLIIKRHLLSPSLLSSCSLLPLHFVFKQHRRHPIGTVPSVSADSIPSSMSSSIWGVGWVDSSVFLRYRYMLPFPCPSGSFSWECQK